MKHLTPKAKLGLTVGIAMVLLILLTALLLAFLKRPRAWEPLDPETYHLILVGDSSDPILFGDHAEDFVRLVNDQITGRSGASEDGYGGGIVTLYSADGFTDLFFSRSFSSVTPGPLGNLSFRPDDWPCGLALVARMKELRDPTASVQPMPTAEEVLQATIVQNGATSQLDAAQIESFCAALPLLDTHNVVQNVSLAQIPHDWLVTLFLSDDISLQIIHVTHFSTAYVQLRFSIREHPIRSPGRIYRLNPGSDPFADLGFPVQSP